MVHIIKKASTVWRWRKTFYTLKWRNHEFDWTFYCNDWNWMVLQHTFVSLPEVKPRLPSLNNGECVCACWRWFNEQVSKCYMNRANKTNTVNIKMVNPSRWTDLSIQKPPVFAQIIIVLNLLSPSISLDSPSSILSQFFSIQFCCIHKQELLHPIHFHFEFSLSSCYGSVQTQILRRITTTTAQKTSCVSVYN